ncbi:MAG TPA: spore coat associated protein CotJA [Clostridiales bacterium]|jgi:hypothetical protein|nr:spore coat associated protein CotJA [Clostridia bacterium]MDD4679840.1 spore coat associated protein CotJA [Clostridia bacterium]HCS75171.1 spore coat associated protein CotJA [Clostridiales bacterium]
MDSNNRVDSTGTELRELNTPVEPNLRLARAYVPDQVYANVFPPEEALREGTLFPELVMPYMAGKVRGVLQ